MVLVGYLENNVKAKDAVLIPVCVMSLGAFMEMPKVCVTYHTLFKCVPPSPYLLGFSWQNSSGFLTSI